MGVLLAALILPEHVGTASSRAVWRATPGLVKAAMFLSVAIAMAGRAFDLVRLYGYAALVVAATAVVSAGGLSWAWMPLLTGAGVAPAGAFVLARFVRRTTLPEGADQE